MTTHAHAMHPDGGSLNRLAARATLHCLTGCAIGEVLGMVIGTALAWSDAATIALAVSLAFVFGYALTLLPLVRSGVALTAALPIAFAADSFSIAVMELVDNGVMLAVPGAMDAPLSNGLFWGALAFALAVAYVVALPVNRYLIARGRGHAVVHAHHDDSGSDRARAAHHDASPWRLVAVGVVAMTVTIGVATGGALVLERDSHGADAKTATAGAGDHGKEAMLSGLAVARDGYRLVVSNTRIEAGEPTPFRFTVVRAGAPVRTFDVEGGVEMHLVVVRRDLTGYQHVHPTRQPDGSWETELTLPAAGVYRAYADFERSGTKTVLAVDLFVGGRFVPQALPDSAARGVDVGGYRVTLASDAEPGMEAELEYRISRDGVPVDVEPYLGAAGHLVALREGDLAYLHVHPLAERRGAITFAATFPTPGRYRLFLQFEDAGRVRTAPLTVSVRDRAADRRTS